MTILNDKQCAHCGVTYTPTGRNSKFCSKSCKYKAKHASYREAMAAAGTPLRPTPGGNPRGRRGIEHHAYKTGIGLFKAHLSAAYRADVGACERCAVDLRSCRPGTWAVHHRDHDRTNNNPANFELLCKRCHQLEHNCTANLPNGKQQGATTIPQGSTAKRPEAPRPGPTG